MSLCVRDVDNYQIAKVIVWAHFKKKKEMTHCFAAFEMSTAA